MEFSDRAQRSVFDDWTDSLRAWQREIGVDERIELETKFADAIEPAIGYGRYAGERRWEKLAEVPSGEIKDELLRLLVWQADSEVRAVEQARELLDSAPSDHDRRRLVRHMGDEQRHGWQMAYLMVAHFGAEGRSEARKLLERRATRGEALLEMFNVRLNWVDVFSWHNWGDRVGKYQLTMFGDCGFAPFARSIAPMLQEESFHLAMGHQGMQRIAAAGRVPVEIHQRYIDRMLAICYDAFGAEVSGRARKIYDWGLKGPWGRAAIDPARANEHARDAFMDEVRKLMAQINRLLPAGSEPLRVTDPRFNRHSGPHAGQAWDGPERLPTEDDAAALAQIFKSRDWIAEGRE
jgi:1,2-phenylacetyl-CoA epoxidase catalytic subunit